ncbi:MAG: PAS domain S-box protein [Gammaproteobacteria bacterium]|nr:PAS domain S-box protein [Gammaproteobacteria bacterium]
MINELKNIWTASVARQLILGIALVHAVLMSIFVFDLVERQREFMIEQSTSQVKGLAETLAANGTSWILSNDIVGVEEVIRSQSRFPGLDYAMFLDMNGKVLGYTQREKVGLFIKDSISQSLFNLPSRTQLLINNSSFIDVAAPVMIKNQQIGWARVGVNRNEIVQSLDLVTKNGLIYTMIAISIGIIFAWFMARNLTSAIRRLTLAIQQVIRGERDVKCVIDRQDEIGTLSQDFNLMLLSIKEHEQKVIQSHEALVESEVKFRRLVQGLSSEYFLYSHDCEGVFTYATESVQTILGYTPEEFKIDCASFLTLHPVNELAKRHIQNSIKGHLQPSYEIEIYHKNGDKIWLNITEVPVFDKDDHVVSVEGIARDISQQKNFENILLEKEREQSEILDNILDGVLTLDENGLILTCNPAAEKIFGYTFSELKNKSFAMLLSASNLYSLIPDSRSNEEEDVFDLIGIRRQDKNEVFVDLDAERKDGKTFPVRLSLARLSLEKNGTQHYICSCSDRTEQKYQEEQFRRSQKMDALGKLTGGIAHDFNNMLGVILGYSELISMKVTDNTKVSKYVDEIQHAGERGKKLTQKLLAFSRRKEMQSEAVDLNLLLNDNRHMLAKSLTSKIDLKYNLQDDIWKLWFDKSDMEDALINICINAMHAMPKGGTLTIYTENVVLSTEQAKLHNLKPGPHVHLSITDTGTGMDDQTRSQIFDPFFTTKDDIGTGLGLSQVYGFVQSAEGAINVYSELDHGTSFSMYFPEYTEKPIQAIKQLSDNETGSEILDGHGEQILLVDDEPSLLLLGEEILNLHGYHVITADSAKIALEKLQLSQTRKKISLMICDVIMPEMDGYELSKIVSEKYPDIKIQLSSGFNDDRHINFVDDSLHKKMLTKPYTSETLLKRVEELLG